MPKTLTIRSFLPQEEIDICHRFRQVRIEQNLDQRDLAEWLGVSRSRIASYEYAKAPLRYDLGNAFCARFHINQRWLATGALPMLPYFPIAADLAAKIDNRGLFSVGFKLLDVPLSWAQAELIEKVGEREYYTGYFESSVLKEITAVGDLANPLIVSARKVIHLWFAWLPEDLGVEYAEAILKANKAFQKKFRVQISKLLPPVDRPNPQAAEKSLQAISPKSKSESMSEIQKLIKDVKKKADQPGARSELAKVLGVVPARISEWLSGKKEPGGEYALRLQKWVLES